MPAAPLDLLQLLYTAAHSPLGTVVETEDVERLRAKLYQLRSEDPAFADLSFITSPLNQESELWIVKRNPAGEE